MTVLKRIILIVMFAAPIFQGGWAQAALRIGENAPEFPQMENLKKNPLTIIYFFKTDSKPSREGLNHLKWLYENYQKEGIGIIGINSEPSTTLDLFLKSNPVPFPIFKDDGTLFHHYQVAVIYPVTYLLAPGGRISDVIEGAGESPAFFITTVAQRSLQLKKTEIARGIYESTLKSDPKNVKARSGLAEVHLREGKLERAEAEFSDLAKQNASHSQLGKEGLAKLHLKKGEPEKAILIAEEIERERSDSGFVHLIKGNLLAAQGKSDAALSEYTKAINGKFSGNDQVAEAYNNAGRIYSDRGENSLAEKMYREAVVHNPFSSEILSNRGMLFAKKGESKKAIAFYEEALNADPDDEIARGLIKQMEKHLAFKDDLERQKRIDTLVLDLADRYQKGKPSQNQAGDVWSSKPMNMAFIGFKSTGGGQIRAGMTEVIEQEITQGLIDKGRVSVVEREILDKLLAELKLGSSELADPDTALKLGKILSARLIVTGTLGLVQEGVRLSLRIIDPETSAIRIVYSNETKGNKSLASLSGETAAALNRKISEEYPLKGIIASVETDEKVIINLGIRHGVKPGTLLRIIDEGEPIEVDGKIIGRKKKEIGLLQVTDVEDGISYAKLVEHQETVQKNQRVLEVFNKEVKGP